MILSRRLGALGVSVACLIALAASDSPRPAQAQSGPPNILFFIVDDLGIDQLGMFNAESIAPPATPNLEFIARSGVKFTNVWAMPECSPSRAAFFTGRYPIHNGVEAAIMENHLPQSYMSQFETTLPRVLAKGGYASALVGKYHLGNEQDPAGNCAPSTRGWASFTGAMTAGPPAIDRTAGGVDKNANQACGYFQTNAAGACYTAPRDAVLCQTIDGSNTDPGTDPSRTCLQRGGIFVPNKACRVNAPTYSDFKRNNGYYAWPRTTLSGLRSPYFIADASCGSVTDRQYLSKAQSNDGISWWLSQTGPRMLTISYNAVHTPIQKPPTDLDPDARNRPATCDSFQIQRATLNSMIDGVDAEVGRTLAALGLGTLGGPNDRVLTSLDLSNTLVVIIGDNGSQGPAARLLSNTNPPRQIFDPQRAKTTVYQTGVWVPMIVAGPVVQGVNRKVNAMINAVDLFKLFGDVAGVKVEEIVPPSHALDSEPMLSYLTTVNPAPVRTTNFTQSGAAIFSPVPEERSWPCQIGNLCNDTLFNNQQFCSDNGGVWWGPGGNQQATSCCAVQAALGTPLSIAPAHQKAVRNRNFKLIELESPNCSVPLASASRKAYPWAEHEMQTTQEFYDIRPVNQGDPTAPIYNPKGVDFPEFNLAQNCPQDPMACLPTNLDKTNYTQLNDELKRIKKSAKTQNRCQAKGDGNQDQRINQADIDGWTAFKGKGPSRYDINLDGLTDENDLNIINANLGLDCMDVCVRADLNRDGKVTNADMKLLRAQAGACTDLAFCGGDLNGDGRVNAADVTLMTQAQQSCP
jgi:arylsulfatase A-like enzyme